MGNGRKVKGQRPTVFCFDFPTFSHFILSFHKQYLKLMFMKKYLGIFILALLALAFSCKKDEVNKEEDKKEELSSCTNCGKKTGEVTEREGRIMFDKKAERYVLYSYIPGTIDAFRAGYLCDLPKEYQKEGKEVIVSGTTYETTLRLQLPVCCVDENYCLATSSIKAK